MQIIGTIVVCLIFIGIGLFLFIRGLALYRRAKESSHWLYVKGQVAATELDRKSDGEGGWEYYPMITYTYSIDGQQYESQRIIFGGPVGTSKFLAEEELSRYWPGKKVNVYYDPEDPAQTVLAPGGTRVVWRWLIGGAGFAALGAAGLITSIQ